MGNLVVVIGPLLFGLGIWCLLDAWQSLLVRISERYDIPGRLRVAARWYVLGVIPLLLALIGGTFMLSLVLVRQTGNEPRSSLVLTIGLYVLTASPAYARWFKASSVRKALGYRA
jgi:hypothetical protein